MGKYLFILILLATTAFYGLKTFKSGTVQEVSNAIAEKETSPFEQDSKPTLDLKQPAESKLLRSDYHVFQTFNNCGPAALSMTLYYYGIKKSQQELGRDLRPYQNSQGDNDDKSVTLAELAVKSKEFGFTPFHRPNGNIDLIKLFITYDLPVIVRTWQSEGEDIGHFRVIKGYDDILGQITQDDSLQGKNLEYSYERINSLWQAYSYEYLVLVPKDKVEIVKAILGRDADEKVAWQKAVERIEADLEADPSNMHARLSLSVALYNVGDFKRSVEEFEKVESRLPFRTLWYQIEPIQAYYQLGNYSRVLSMTEDILSNHNRAFTELYILRGDIFLKQGDRGAAKSEYEKAVLYNVNNLEAKQKLQSLEN